MTLDEAKILLDQNSIQYEMCEFPSEATYWQHISSFAYTKKAKHCKVTAIIIRSPNGHKHIELQFNIIDGIPQFEELWFGEYSYEMFGCEEKILSDDLIERITEITQGRLKFITANDINRKHRIGDAVFGLDENDLFGYPGFQRAMARIQKPKSLWARLTRQQRQYEIYDWNTYQCIMK